MSFQHILSSLCAKPNYIFTQLCCGNSNEKELVQAGAKRSNVLERDAIRVHFKCILSTRLVLAFRLGNTLFWVLSVCAMCKCSITNVAKCGQSPEPYTLYTSYCNRMNKIFRMVNISALIRSMSTHYLQKLVRMHCTRIHIYAYRHACCLPIVSPI